MLIVVKEYRGTKFETFARDNITHFMNYTILASK